jgi:hypothetical protein
VKVIVMKTLLTPRLHPRGASITYRLDCKFLLSHRYCTSPLTAYIFYFVSPLSRPLNGTSIRICRRHIVLGTKLPPDIPYAGTCVSRPFRQFLPPSVWPRFSEMSDLQSGSMYSLQEAEGNVIFPNAVAGEDRNTDPRFSFCIFFRRFPPPATLNGFDPLSCLQMKCDFPKNENTCKRCKAGGHQCIVEGRKPRTAPK